MIGNWDVENTHATIEPLHNIYSNSYRSGALTIKNRQNEDYFILRLAASSRLYSLSKKLNNASIMLNVVLMTIVTFISLALNSEYLTKLANIEKIDISNWVAVISILVLTLNNSLIGDKIELFKEKAAKVQDEVDRQLFGLTWNEPLAGRRVRAEDITKHGEWLIRKGGNTRFRDWYPVPSDNLSIPKQVLICQNSCLSWDVSLRNRVNIIILALGILITFTAVGFALALDLTTTTVITNIVALLGPVYDYGFNTYKANKASIENNERLLECVTTTINQARNSTDTQINNIVIQIQDQLFIKRKSDWSIPDSLYKVLRNSHENIMGKSSTELANILNGKTP